jgi:phosphoglycolate phosphatase
VAAQAAGMRAVGVTWGCKSRAELEASGACAVIDSSEEVVAACGFRA